MKVLSLQNIIKKSKAIKYRKYYVVLDGRANSVTISKALYNHMMRYERHNTEILVFKSSDTKLYGFTMREDYPMLMQKDSNYCSLQYNEQYHKIGFRSDHPSVTAILDEYNLPMERMVRLSVIVRHTPNGEAFYEIQKQ